MAFFSGLLQEVSAIVAVPLKDVPGKPAVPDVDAIMQRVQAGAAARISGGVYSPADLAEVRRVEQDILARTGSGLSAADDIAQLHSLWDPLGPHDFSSHRVGAGKAIVTAKRWLRRLAMPVAAVALARQARFNSVVARVLTGASHGVQSLETGAAALQRRLEELERRNRELNARCDDVQAEVRGLKARLESDGDAR